MQMPSSNAWARHGLILALGAVLLAGVGASLTSCSDEKTAARQKSLPVDGGDQVEKTDGTKKEEDQSDLKKGTGGSAEAGEEFYSSKVLIAFRGDCMSCHADPRIEVLVRGPLTIYSYNAMKKLLADGESSVSNALIDKIRGVADHDGGARCKGGDITASPCDIVVEWWRAEFGDDSAEVGSDGGGGPGKVSEITPVGKVYGWAVDPDDKEKIIPVKFYIGGDESTGTLIDEIQANVSGPDGGAPGNHAFRYELPEQYRDGVKRTLMVYATIGGKSVPLLKEPQGFAAYMPSEEGRAYYEGTVKPLLQQCQQCHGVTYETQFYSLLVPSPADGGTATRNELINKASTTNGFSHRGGNRCGSISGSPCKEFQEWWRIEFGN